MIQQMMNAPDIQIESEPPTLAPGTQIESKSPTLRPTKEDKALKEDEALPAEPEPLQMQRPPQKGEPKVACAYA